MTAIIVIECIILLFLLVSSAFFSSAETALFFLNPIQVQHIRASDPKAADRIKQMLAVPTELLSTILIGNTIVNVAVSAVGFAIIKNFNFTYPALLSIPIMTIILLILGEVAPKRIAMARPEQVARCYAWMLTVLIILCTPFRAILQKIASLFDKDLHAADKSLTEDEFLTVVEVGEMEGVLDEEERTMVDGIIRLEETEASEVMTPRVDLIGIDLDDTQEEQVKIAERSQFRYLPVYRDSIDKPEGFLDVPHFLLSSDKNLKTAIIPPFFVPETAPLDDLLAKFQKENRRVAFVTDEYGGTAGLITRGDILEEIIDDVDNEYGEEHITLQKVGNDRWLVDGNTSIEDINYELDLDLEKDGADRISGWVLAEAERIPKAGDIINHQGCRVTVQRIRRNRVTLVLLEKLAAEIGSEDA